MTGRCLWLTMWGVLTSTDAVASACDASATGNTMHCNGAGGGRISQVIDIPSYQAGFDDYSCTVDAQPGPERVTQFRCDYASQVRLEVRDTECDVDVFVVNSTCEGGGSCVGFDESPHVPGQDFSVTFQCLAGIDYYVIVEGRAAALGSAGGCPIYQDDVDGSGFITPSFERGRGSRFTLVPYCSEDCDDGFDNDRDGLFDCNDSDCADVPPCAEDCDLPGDEDGNGLADCLDPACEVCAEDCGVAGDEDGDGLADCDDPDCADTEICCDLDGDGDYADTSFCSFGGDCDDNDPDIGPSAPESPADGIDANCDGVDDCYLDADLDGFGRDEAILGDDLDCSNLPGEAANRADCDDESADVYPGATEIVGDGEDQDCDGVDQCYLDADGDGFGSDTVVVGASLTCAETGRVSTSGDCVDVGAYAATIFPGALERCNGYDDDCDLLIDDADGDVFGRSIWYADLDGDGFAGSAESVERCVAPSGYDAIPFDCRDVGPDAELVYPGASEIAGDGIDQDCDGVDACFVDLDGDGFGTDVTVPGDDLVCGSGAGSAAVSGDCRDVGALASLVFPGAVEQCDGVDNDCDGLTDDADDDVTGQTSWYRDSDGDGFAGALVSVSSCTAPPGWQASAADCDDVLDAVFPGAPEVCNGRDDDCDGLVDGDDTLSSVYAVFVDQDGDGFGQTGSAVLLNVCEIPEGYSDEDGDCDDTDAEVRPGADEIPYDGVDQDCVDGDLTDVDGDGFAGGTLGVDCVDTDPAVAPGLQELPDGVDQDCDGVVDEGTERFDDDGDGVTELGGDCDDTNRDVRPGGQEPSACNGLDDDCNGVIDDGTLCADDDGDGFSELAGDCADGDPSVSPAGVDVAGSGVDGNCDGVLAGADGDGDGWSTAGGDCDDADPAVRPGAEELLNGADDDCDGVIDEMTEAFDDDGDGFSEASGDCDDADAGIQPGALENVSNGRDDDCDGVVDEGGPHRDDDGDGYAESAGDCDDMSPEVFPFADEIANGVDDDCDGVVDDGVLDRDQDGWTTEEGDCDDDQGWANPGLVELCDGIDNDCDEAIDEGCAGDVVAPPPAETGGCGCATAAPGAGAWLSFGLWITLMGRRRRT